MKSLCIIESNIKGYHHFKLRPHPAIGMIVEPETNNIYDPDAMIMKMPLLENIPVKYHEDITKESTNGDEQRVKDIAGRSIGRVPANVCKVFKILLEQRDVYSITCYSKDKPTISKKPHSCQSFRKKPRKKDIRGGGGVIPCNFVLRCFEVKYDKVYRLVRDTLKSLESEGTERLLPDKDLRELDSYM